jgi:phosphate starvation-inducible PhoH-like protein
MSRKRRKKERCQKLGAHHSGHQASDPMAGYTGQKLVARSWNQHVYKKAIDDHVLTMVYGPPGSGKTHIAAGWAVHLMRAKQTSKIVMCRPVVPVGRELGHLPGDLNAKLDPYLRPLFDELNCFVTYELLKHWTDTMKLEICPLQVMRGRTFNDAVVILDEAQNATKSELKMFFTRFGQNSKVIVTGDLRQSDLPKHEQGAFADALDMLEDLPQTAVCELTRGDIVRHELIGMIEDRYNRSEEECIATA